MRGPNHARPGHNGIDAQCNRGDFVRAVHRGIVVAVDNWPSSDGIFVRVDEGCGSGQTQQSVYLHLEYASVRVGDRVRVGDVVGGCDSTGHSTGDHLHLTIYDRPGGAVENPETELGKCP
ncbi:MAG: M23 family metallopeptidase [Acidobacteria bacterium]|nr:MAG: M23 family metallopeptidase [Acidobacteriota bacterium]